MAENVTVICRMPSGVKLDLYDMQALSERAAVLKQGGFPPQLAPIKVVTLKGASSDMRFHKADNVLIGMAGRNIVDAEFWEAWLAQNQNSQLVTKGLVFAEKNSKRAEAKFKEVKSEKTGLESLDSSKPIEGVTKLDK
ncbi:hypothetical protein FAI40_10085 [Acetobacteraceae bacterium]|nr:hypothetical protein FAI40_10085 [Acetobacteraceae bacterium]